MCTRTLDGERVEFGTSGYTKDHVFVLYDRATESIWWPLSDDTLDAVAGRRRGESIAFLEEPAPEPLSEWLASHPDSTVLLPTEQDAETIDWMRNGPYLGVELAESDEGLAIAAVLAGTAAEEAGLLAGDVFVSLGGHAVPDREALGEALAGFRAEETTVVVVERAGTELAAEVTFGRRAP